MPVLPAFDDKGLLPPGDYSLTLEELAESPLVKGSRTLGSSWHVGWRTMLARNLAVMVHQLWKVGINDIFVDGSFVEEKDRPNDIDGYFACDFTRLASGELERELNKQEPHKIWTWDPASRRSVPGFPKNQLPMWIKYRVELYPHAIGGPPSVTGIKDRHGNDLEFPAAFRQCRSTCAPKGIIKLVRSAT